MQWLIKWQLQKELDHKKPKQNKERNNSSHRQKKSTKDKWLKKKQKKQQREEKKSKQQKKQQLKLREIPHKQKCSMLPMKPQLELIWRIWKQIFKLNSRLKLIKGPTQKIYWLLHNKMIAPSNKLPFLIHHLSLPKFLPSII